MPDKAADATLTEALDAALAVAPSCRTLVQVGRNVNAELGIEWTDGKWRGIWKDKPELKFATEKLLGTAERRVVKTLRVPGNVRGFSANDMHAPYQDDNAIKLACKVVKWWKPDLGVLNGDINDFPGLSSKFDPNPRRQSRAQDEVYTAQTKVLIPFKTAVGSNGRLVALPGNHDARLRLLLWKHPDLFSIRGLELPELWELDKLGIGYAEYAVEIDDLLHVSHGTKVASEAGYAAKGELAKRHWSISTMTGHVHRSGSTSAKVGNRWVYGREVPCLCSLEPEYMNDANWSLGFALFEVRNGNVHTIPVDIYSDYTCCVGNKWFGLD